MKETEIPGRTGRDARKGAAFGYVILAVLAVGSLLLQIFLVHRVNGPSAGFAFGIDLLLLALLFCGATVAYRRYERERIRAMIELEEAKRLAQEKEIWWQTTMRSMGDAMIVTDPKGNVLFLNPVAESLTGWRQEDAVQKPINDVFRIVHSHSREPVACPVKNVMKSGQVVTMPDHSVLLSRNGAEHQIADSCAPIRMENGKIAGVVLVFRDISEKHRIDEELVKFKTMIDRADFGAAILSPDGTVEYCNQTFAWLHHAKEDPTTKRLNLNCFRDGQAFTECIAEQIGSGHRIEAEEWRLSLPGGVELVCLLTATLIRAPGGAPSFIALNSTDITERNRIQEQLRHSRKMDSIGQLAGGVAHDFNNMLGGIIGYSEILAIKLKSEDPLSRYAQLIIKAAQRAAELTEKLLLFSRKGRMTIAPVSLHQVILDAASLLEHSIDRRISIIKKLEASHSTILGDTSQLQNVFLNLGVNARDAIAEGGTIGIRTRNVILGQHEPSCHALGLKPGNYIEIEFSDSGCGIDKEVIGRIFEPFYTTKELGKGTGLGLSAVYGAVQDHAGSITVDSEPGNGTRFHILLPVIQDAPSPAENKSQHRIGDGEAILVVDDEEIVRIALRDMLQESGFQVITASNGQECLDIFFQNPDRFALVILDIVMPLLDGRACYRSLRVRKSDVPILLCSGYTRDSGMINLSEDQKLGFIKKPFAWDELTGAIRNLLAIGPETH